MEQKKMGTYLMKTEDGMLVSVREDEVKDFLRGQEERKGMSQRTIADMTEAERFAASEMLLKNPGQES